MYKILDICIVYHFFYEKSINFIKGLINDDFNLISDGLNEEENSFDISVCKNSCKSMKNCCKNILKED